jgi:hypothetical protein
MSPSAIVEGAAEPSKEHIESHNDPRRWHLTSRRETLLASRHGKLIIIKPIIIKSAQSNNKYTGGKYHLGMQGSHNHTPVSTKLRSDSERRGNTFVDRKEDLSVGQQFRSLRRYIY